MAEKIDRFFCAPLQYRYWALTMLSVRLGDLLEIGNGRNYSILKKSGQYPVYGSGGLMGYTDNFLHDGESVLLPRKGTLNNIQFVTGRFWTVDTIYFSRIDDRKVDPYFLFRYLKLLDLKNLNTGTGVPSMTQKVYEDIPLILPTLGTQYNIAKILRLLDKKIKLNNTINARLEEMARNLYNFWFIQFEFPDESGRPFKTAGGEMVYSEELKRKIPVGWTAEKIKEFLEFDKGKEVGSSAYFDVQQHGFVRFYRVGDIDGSSTTFVSNKNILNIAKPSDVVVTFDGSVGKLGVGLDGAISGGLRKIYDKLGEIDNSFVWLLFLDQRIKTTIERYATGSVLLHASSSISHLNMPFNKEVVLRFQEAVKPIFKQYINNKQEVANLAELRDYLLPLLVNGRVFVGD